MRHSSQLLWRDESGFVVSGELVIVATVGILAMVVGLEAISSSVIQELNDLSSAFGAIDQSFNYRSIAKPRHAWVRGSGFNDARDYCDCDVAVFTEVGGKTTGSVSELDATVQQVLPAPITNERVISERVISETPVETPAPVIKAEPCPDPEEEIIEERIIRRRIVHPSDCSTAPVLVKPLPEKVKTQPEKPHTLKPQPSEVLPHPKKPELDKPGPIEIRPKKRPASAN